MEHARGVGEQGRERLRAARFETGEQGPIALDRPALRIDDQHPERQIAKQRAVFLAAFGRGLYRSFSGREAWKRQQSVLYVTERCVFRLCEGGLELVETAPGIDLERDILAHMDFAPVINRPPRLMNTAIFHAGPMALREQLLAKPLAGRMSYEPTEGIFFANFEWLRIASRRASRLCAQRPRRRSAGSGTASMRS